MNFFFLLFFLASFSVESSLQENNDCNYPYKLRVVEEINEKRRIHQAPPLVLDTSNADLVRYTQENAEYMAGKGAAPPVRPLNISFGEIDVSYEARATTPEQLVDVLYRTGEPGYPWYGREPPSEAAIAEFAIFTQMIWVASQNATVGCSDAGDGRRFLVAAFVPPGNIWGEFAKNVLPPRP